MSQQLSDFCFTFLFEYVIIELLESVEYLGFGGGFFVSKTRKGGYNFKI